ncbi:hypothetical protein, partial [Nostoc sp.]|uniref:hypothetical protein n=1 Tax=Nostoc sp. TaxID=1180 RepID=UPI002FF85A57
NVSSKKDDKLELLPQRVSREELEPQKTELQPELSGQVDTQEQERHKLLVPNRKQHLKKIW